MPLPRVNYAARVRYHDENKAKHRATVRRAPLKALHSWARNLGDALFGAFMAPNPA